MGARRWWPAVGVVGVITALGLILSVLGLFAGDHDPAPAAAAPSTAPDAAEPSVCGLPDVALTGTVDRAPAATWSMVGTVAAPTVDGQGPGVIDDDGFRSCFAHTPTGAVVAGYNLAAMGSYDPVRSRFDAEAVAPGPGRDAGLADPAPQGGPSGGPRPEFVGFRVLRYTGQQADLDLALLSSTGQMFGFTAYLEWAEGDWKVRVADDGSDLSSVSPISSLSGYVAWGADSG